MSIPRSQRIVFLRTSIIATGVSIGLLLHWLYPPTHDVLFDSTGTGGARPRAGRVDEDLEQKGEASKSRAQADSGEVSEESDSSATPDKQL